MKVSVVIPTLVKNRTYFHRCLSCLMTQSISLDDFEVIVVNNNTQQRFSISKGLMNLKILHLNSNQGFAGATNKGIEVAEGEYIATLNDDCFVEHDWLKKLLKTAQKTGDHMIASTIYHPKVTDPDLCPEKKEQWELDSLGFMYQKKGRAPINKDATAQPFGADAAAALYSRTLLDDVGVFDESFFAYLEDVDLAVRAQKKGFKCSLSPARAYHLKHQTSKHTSNFKQRQDMINWWRIVLKNYSVKDWRTNGIEILTERARNLSGVVKSYF